MTTDNKLRPLPVLAHTCLLGESPVWDTMQQLICWVDILKGEAHQYSPENKAHTVIAVNQMLGSVGLCTNGDFIAALQNGFAFINRTNHQVTMIHDPEADLPGNRFNEGKCAPEGRFWAGTLSLNERPNAGALYCLQPDLSVITKIKGVTISNGITWSMDQQVFYYIDTPTLEIAAYKYDTVNGAITGRKTAITLPAEEGFPDGMTTDNEGMLWVAFWGGWKVARWNPHTGKKLLEIRLPVANVSSCTFGGPQLQDLFITSAAKDLTDEEMQDQPLAGSLFVIENCGFTGLPAYRFSKPN